MTAIVHRTLGAVVLLVLATPCVGNADVLCRKKSGAVFSRAACKGKEVTLGPVGNLIQGPPGPAGPPGPEGPRGADGAAGAPGPSVDMSLLPIAFGHVDANAELFYGKNVGTPIWNAGASQYEIPILDPSGTPLIYFYENYATVASADVELTAMVSSNAQKLVVRLIDKDGQRVQGPFQFVTYLIHPL